jgi:hypothetical protein
MTVGDGDALGMDKKPGAELCRRAILIQCDNLDHSWFSPFYDLRNSIRL